MIVWAAIDLRGGRVVQLVGGRPGQERVSLPDPVQVARQWVDAGFEALHVVDLDAALGTGDNRSAIRGILGAVDVPVQVGGGLRDDASIDAMLDAGAARAVVGTRAVEERAWLESNAVRHPGRLVVAADVRDGIVVTRGWTESVGVAGDRFVAGLDVIDLAGILVTDVTREGGMAGIDATLFRTLIAATEHPLLAAGGIGSLEDLRALRDAGAAGAVLGMSLYTGAITADAVAQELGE